MRVKISRPVRIIVFRFTVAFVSLLVESLIGTYRGSWVAARYRLDTLEG